MSTLCRDCLDPSLPDGSSQCDACHSRRLVSHPELTELTIAHLDCDSFYASVEKRDDPTLRNKPVLVGGQKRGVVMAACYVARQFGIRSAMPMYKALRACPDAVVIRPDMAKYVRVGGEVRDMMRKATPLVEPISIDEAFLDLGGTERLHDGSAARTLARLSRDIEEVLRITVSIGLSHNKFLAKLASGLEKPRGFMVIGRQEATSMLAELPVSKIWGVGAVTQDRLAAEGIRTIGQLQTRPVEELVQRYGKLGRRLTQLAHGRDTRLVTPDTVRKSLSSETTFSDDVSDVEELKRRLWVLVEKVSREAKSKEIGGRTVTLKLKTRDFRVLTRSRSLSHPTQLAEAIYRVSVPLLEREAKGTRFRLLGIGLSELATADACDVIDLADPDGLRRKNAELAMDRLRERFGDEVISKGRSLKVQTMQDETFHC